jgi:beta-lactam-binding protein with PASTA domain
VPGTRPVSTVPDVLGLDARAAARRVLAAHLTPCGREHTRAPEHGIITTQTPDPGARALPAAPVVLETRPGAGHRAEPVCPVPSGTDALTPR